MRRSDAEYECRCSAGFVGGIPGVVRWPAAVAVFVGQAGQQVLYWKIVMFRLRNG